MNDTETRSHWLLHHTKLWIGPVALSAIGLVLLPTLLMRHWKLQGALESMVADDTVTALVREQGELTSGLLLLLSTFFVLLVIAYTMLQYHAYLLESRGKYQEQKTSFVRMAADTIRTPLTGLRWITELMMGGDLGALSASQKDSLGNMNKAIERVIKLVNELLNIMRLSGGIIQYHPKDSDVNILIRNVIKDSEAIAAAKHQTLGFGGVSKDASIMLDEPLIRHLFSSLVANAVHQATIGDTIVIHAEPTDLETTIGITYHGEPLTMKTVNPDMTENIQDIIMRPGEDDSLSLAVSWEILSAARGRFWVRDEPTEHTLFIALPRKFDAKIAMEPVVS